MNMIRKVFFYIVIFSVFDKQVGADAIDQILRLKLIGKIGLRYSWPFVFSELCY